jgi:diguanylate cyclase (GGDEF)-like protein
MEIKRAQRYQHPLSLILCDIDFFKKINDTFGHLVGDDVLKKFVECMTDAIRSSVDWMVRYGGEEFVIVLPETDYQGAVCLAERLRGTIEKKAIPVKDTRIHITSSFGVTSVDRITSECEISPDDFISKADKYLYEAKQRGRNLVMAGLLQPV